MVTTHLAVHNLQSYMLQAGQSVRGPHTHRLHTDPFKILLHTQVDTAAMSAGMGIDSLPAGVPATGAVLLAFQDFTLSRLVALFSWIVDQKVCQQTCMSSKCLNTDAYMACHVGLANQSRLLPLSCHVTSHASRGRSCKHADNRWHYCMLSAKTGDRQLSAPCKPQCAGEWHKYGLRKQVVGPVSGCSSS